MRASLYFIEAYDAKTLLDIQLKVTLAALHTSAAAPMELVYDLCTMPGYVGPLREELDAVLAECGGRLDRAALGRLHRLDSFMKESQRHNPLLLTTFDRVVHAEYTLSDGFKIPAGTTVCAPSHAIAMDAAIFPNPREFDGFRFSVRVSPFHAC